MGRTLTYGVVSGKIFSAQYPKLKRLYSRYCDNFEWTCEYPDEISAEWDLWFTKVGSNELNAHTIIKYVHEASMIIPKCVFNLKDEGDALYCPIHLKNGLARPDFEEMKKNLKFWDGKEHLHDNGLWDVTSREQYFKKLIELKPDFGDINQYIRPLADEAYLNKRKSTATQTIDISKPVNPSDIVKSFLENEKVTSDLNYKLPLTYPVL